MRLYTFQAVNDCYIILIFSFENRIWFSLCSISYKYRGCNGELQNKGINNQVKHHINEDSITMLWMMKGYFQIKNLVSQGFQNTAHM